MAIPFEINRSRIISSIATLFSGSVVAQGMTALALLLTARQLKVDGYGLYTASITITSMLAIFFSLGLDVWLLKEGGRAPSRIASLAGSVIGIKAGFGVVWILLLWLITPLFNPQSFPPELLHWSILLIWSDTLLATSLIAYKATLNNRIPSVLEASSDTIWFALTLLLMSLSFTQPGIFIKTRAFVSLIALSISLLLFIRKFGLIFDRYISERALRQCFPFTLSEFLAMVTMRADVVIISLTLGKTATGLYSPAVGLINMAFLVPLAVHLVMVPVLSNLYQNHPMQANKTALRTILLSILLGLGLTILFMVGAPLVVLLLGQSFFGSIEILRILSWLLPFKCGSYAMAAILVATDQQAKRTSIQAIAAIVNIGFNLLVVYTFGINGVAVVYILTEVILFTGYTWFVVRKRREKVIEKKS